MQKKSLSLYPPGRSILKSLLIMKLVLLFSGVFSFSILANVYSQHQHVNIKLQNATAKVLFEEIKAQTGLYFIYNENHLGHLKAINLEMYNKPVNEVLQEVFKDSPVSYRFHDDVIFIVETVPVEQPIQQNERTITGTVKAKGEPAGLPGVAIMVKGTNKGTTSDINGQYNLKVPDEANTLVFSFLGMTTVEVDINARTIIDIVMQSSNVDMDEVVVTGFQNIDRREFTGSVQKVKMADLQQKGVESVDKLLQGQVAGVQIENVSGTTGSRAKIRIRGNSSISGNREPLWVIDGVVMEDAVSINPNELYSGDPATLVSSAIGGLNPNDIEEISVLKDASATALYGTQAVNGVIVVTTRRGKQGTFNVDYAGNFTTELKPRIDDYYMMNSVERIDLTEEMFAKNLINYNNLDFYAGGYGTAVKQYIDKSITEEEFQREVYRIKRENTDWFKHLFKNSLKMEHNLSISSGTEQAQYFFSLNYFKDFGNTLGQNTDRYIANFRSNYKLNDKLQLGVKLNISNKEQLIYNSNVNPFTYARTASRAIPRYTADGQDFYYTYDKADFNVFNEIDNSFSNLSNIDALCQLDLSWKVFNGATINSIVSYRKAFAHVERIYTEQSNVANAYRENDRKFFIDTTNPDQSIEGETILPRGGLLQANDDRSTFFTNRNSITWSKVIDTDHKIDLFAGQEYRSKIYDYQYMFGYGYEYLRGKTANPSFIPIKRSQVYSLDPYFGLNTRPAYTLSFFGTATYTFKGKYTLNTNMRSDGSNQFGDTNRYRFLPIWSVGGNWNITGENFMQDNRFFSNLALRGSYGLRGNVSGFFSPQVQAYYTLSYAIDPADKEEVLYITQPPNPDLQWEKEHIYNIALDFDIKNKVSGSIEYYNRSNYDLISPYPVSYVTGFKDVNLNWASMRNSGIELALNATMLTRPNVRWHTNLTFGYNHNKVLEAFYTPTARALASENVIAPVVGNAMSGIYAFKFAGLDSEGVPLFYDADNNKVHGFDLSTRDTNALEYMGSSEPVYSGGLTNTINYKDWTLSALFVYSGGNKTRLDPVYNYYYNDVENISKEMAHRWQLPGDEQYTNVPAILDLDKQYQMQVQGYDIPYMYNNSDIRVVDASYLKLRNVTLGYNLRPEKHAIRGVGNLLFQVQGNNLWTLAHKRLNGRDPEAMIQGTNMPLLTSFTLSLKAQF